jgi:hypothetical protein
LHRLETGHEETERLEIIRSRVAARRTATTSVRAARGAPPLPPDMPAFAGAPPVFEATGAMPPVPSLPFAAEESFESDPHAPSANTAAAAQAIQVPVPALTRMYDEVLRAALGGSNR